MFAHPIWSLLLLAAPVALYWFVIRPRLDAKLSEIYADLDTFWERLWARTYAFRSVVITSAGAVLAALPDLLVRISSLDLSFLPQPWAAWTMGGASVAVAVMKAFETKPKDEQA
jgi:uncharacterized RDD family membrane protein YckC